jgi:hypothetical protein
MQKFLSLGAECVRIQESADASQGMSIESVASYFYIVVHLSSMIADCLLSFSFFCCVIVALTSAHAHISAMEAELTAAREAWESANAAKVSAEKAAKLAETKAKKAEKALADADQKRVQLEHSIAERLDKISVLVGSKCRVITFGYSFRLVLADICLLLLLVSLWCSRENWRVLETSAAQY